MNIISVFILVLVNKNYLVIVFILFSLTKITLSTNPSSGPPSEVPSPQSPNNEDSIHSSQPEPKPRPTQLDTTSDSPLNNSLHHPHHPIQKSHLSAQTTPKGQGHHPLSHTHGNNLAAISASGTPPSPSMTPQTTDLRHPPHSWHLQYPDRNLWRTRRPPLPISLTATSTPRSATITPLTATELPSLANHWENLCSTLTQQSFKATTPHLSDPTLIRHQFSPGILHTTAAFKKISYLSENMPNCPEQIALTFPTLKPQTKLPTRLRGRIIVAFLKFNLWRTWITSAGSIHPFDLIQRNVWDGHSKKEIQQERKANAHTCIPLLSTRFLGESEGVSNVFLTNFDHFFGGQYKLGSWEATGGG